jgi:hypothetical protein
VTDVLVAVPARDEERRVASCLESVAAALRRARAHGVVDRAAVAVAVHRSTDGTAEVVGDVFAAWPDLETFCHADADSATVGAVRRRLVADACEALGLAFTPHQWLFSTDADSVVPGTWVTDLLAHADTAGAHGVTGLVDLEGWRAHPAALAAYERIVAGGVDAGAHHGGVGGADGAGHRHVYGANLAVRLDAYAACGGFPAVPHGEDHGLVERLRSAGHRVVAVHEPAVLTSARMPGRARHGLGDLLERLATGCACCAG